MVFYGLSTCTICGIKGYSMVPDNVCDDTSWYFMVFKCTLWYFWYFLVHYCMFFLEQFRCLLNFFSTSCIFFYLYNLLLLFICCIFLYYGLLQATRYRLLWWVLIYFYYLLVLPDILACYVSEDCDNFVVKSQQTKTIFACFLLCILTNVLGSQ